MIRIWNFKVRAGPDLSWILVWCFFHRQLKAGLMKLCPHSIYSDVFVTLPFLGSRLLYSATSWAFRSFLCTYWCLGSESIVGQIGEGFLVSIRPGGVPWHFMTISCLINFAHVCKCLSFICWVELHFSPKKKQNVRFLPTMAERRIDPVDDVAPLGSIRTWGMGLSDSSGRCEFVPFLLPCWGIPGKSSQRTILESCLADPVHTSRPRCSHGFPLPISTMRF